MTAEETLAKVRDLHNAWGDTSEDEIRPTVLWETLRRILDGEQ